jgi:hypothetical protein
MAGNEQSKSWRELYRVHPAADILPMMSDEELDDLGKDIKTNGVVSPIVLWIDLNGDEWLLDGRNRLEALQREGLEYDDKCWDPHGLRYYTGDKDEPDDVAYVDPVAYVMSINVKRRHLTAEQKREAIAKLLKLAPERSDRQIAKDVGVDNKTVGATRKKLESTEEIPHSDKRVGADPERAVTTAPPTGGGAETSG